MLFCNTISYRNLCGYTLTSQIIGINTDTTSTYCIIEYTYSNIEGYTKIKTNKSTGSTGYSGDWLGLIGETSGEDEVTIAAADSEGEYDISNYTTIKQSYIYRPGDTYIINLPILLP